MANEAIYFGQQSPSHYNAVKLDSIKTRMPIYSHQLNSKLVRFKPLEKNNLPSPTSYEKNDLKLSSRLTSPNLTFAKDQKQKSFVET